MLHVLTQPLLQVDQCLTLPKKRKPVTPVTEDSEKTFSMASLRRVIDRASSALYSSEMSVVPGSGTYARNLKTPEASVIGSVCSLYTITISALTQIKLNILTALCQNDSLVQSLWHFISSLDEADGLLSFLDFLAVNPKSEGPELQILILFCNCTTHLVT